MKNYSSPYQAPEVDKPRTIPSEGMRGLFPTKDGWAEIDSKGHITKILTKDEFDAYKTDIGENFDKKADKSNTYTKSETERKFVQKSDISNVYKFKGSVENIEDVLIAYSLVPAGNPTINGEVVGTYDSNEIRIKQGTAVPAGDVIKVPIKPITLNQGIYAIGSIFIVINGSGALGDGGLQLNITQTTTITEIYLPIFAEGYVFDEEVVLDIEQFLGYLYIGEEEYNGAAEIGDVYNEISTGMNYAWTGSSWDALGGEHKDLEARKMIGDIETALDSIIEIQNSLMGGEAE